MSGKPFEQSQQQLLTSAFAAIADYVEDSPNRQAYPTAKALARLSDFDVELPTKGTNAKQVLESLISIGKDACVPTTGGRFFGYVSGGVLPIGLAARLVADAWDQASALHAMSPLAAELERICERWIIDLFGLPKETVAGFSTGTSMATFCALAAARHHLLMKAGWDVTQRGIFGAPALRVIVNEKAHSSVWRALRLLGFGEAHIERVATDSEGRILIDEMPSLDAHCILILQAGDVNTGSFDDFTSLCTAANRAGAWTHVDGAFGLWAAASPKYSHLTKGVALADSWACDAHKTLNSPYECGLVLCRQTASYRAAMATGAAYAPITENRDGMALVPEMSRRARAIEVWAILKTLGREGVAELVEQLCARATQMASLLNNAGIEVINDVVFNQVLIAFENDQITQAVLREIQASGRCWCGGSQWGDRAVIRFSVCSWMTTEEDIEVAAETFRAVFAKTQQA